jgi:hypothetical protein
MPKPLAIDLFCGLGGWAEGFLAEGYDVIGFDIEARPYPGQLVLQDVLTLDGAQFRNAAVIVASPPCQKYSYMAMPWTRAKQLAMEYRAHPGRLVELNALFNACFRIRNEASAPAGHQIPLVVENVKGAQPWVGPARAHFGSFYLWGDIDSIGGSIVAGGVRFGNVLTPGKRGTGGKQNPDGTDHPQGSWFKIADSQKRGSKNGGGSSFNVAHNTESGTGQNPQRMREETGVKVPGVDWHNYGKPGYTHPSFRDGLKNGGDWFGSSANCSEQRKHGSKSTARQLASAKIAMIPPPLAQHIARVFKPTTQGGAEP